MHIINKKHLYIRIYDFFFKYVLDVYYIYLF